MDTNTSILDAHFKCHFEINPLKETLYKKTFVAASLNPDPQFPGSFIVKRSKNKFSLPEYLIHNELSNSLEDIPKLWHYWEDEAGFSICIEYFPEGTLQNYLQGHKSQKMCFNYCLAYCYQLAETVFQMHSKNICHRDIQAKNIFISENFSIFKLGNFSKSKITTEAYNMPRDQLDLVLLQKSPDFDPYQEDLCELGKIFWQIYTGRASPDIYSLPIRGIWKIIDDCIGSTQPEIKFSELLKEMICSPENFTINAERVRFKIYEIFIETKNLEDYSGSNEYEMILNNDRNDSVQSIPKIKTSLRDIQQSQIISIENDKKTFNSRDKHQDQITSIGTHEKKTNLRDIQQSQIVSFGYNEKSFAGFSSLRDHSFEHNYESGVSEPLNHITSSLGKYKEDPNEISFQYVKIVNDSSCIQCGLSIEGNQIILPCKHILHQKCFNDFLLKPLLESKKIESLPKCKSCDESISLAYFENLPILNKKSIKNIRLQEYSNFKSFCPNCSHYDLYFFLNNKLKPYNIKCINCSYKFCSFCNIIGGHFLYCKLFREYRKKGSVDQTRYIKKK